MDNSLDYPESFPSLFANTTSPSPAIMSSSTENSHPSSILDWRSFAEHGFDRTSPPTPENVPQVQHIKTAVKSEEMVPYEPLQESEDEGEILVGMGLYDAPDKYEADPGLNNYRSSLSSLLGGAPKLQDSPGKGLKLEETWQPPESDDEEDEDEEEDDENEGEKEKSEN